MNTSMNIAAPHTTSSGPRCLSCGTVIGPSLRPCTSTCRVSCRYAARKMMIAILPNSAGWKATGPELDAEVGAVDLLADPGHARQQQQQQADERDRVAVALEHAEVAQQQDRRREQDQADDEPLRLLARERVVDPVDDDEPEAREHAHEREHVRVRVGQREADHEVPGEAQQQEDRAVGQRDVRELLGLLDEDRGEPGGQQQRRRDQRHQLAVAGAHDSICPRSSWITRFSASSFERSL